MWTIFWLVLPLVALTSLIGSALVVVDRGVGTATGAALIEAAVLAASSATLVGYVASDDDYRDNGVSRWEAYDAQVLTSVAVAAGVVAAAALVLTWRSRRRPLAVTAFLSAAGAAALQFVAFLANSLN